MAGVEHRDAASEINITTPFDVPQLGILRPFGKDWARAGHTARNRLLAARPHFGIAGHDYSSSNRLKVLEGEAEIAPPSDTLLDLDGNHAGVETFIPFVDVHGLDRAVTTAPRAGLPSSSLP